MSYFPYTRLNVSVYQDGVDSTIHINVFYLCLYRNGPFGPLKTVLGGSPKGTSARGTSSVAPFLAPQLLFYGAFL